MPSRKGRRGRQQGSAPTASPALAFGEVRDMNDQLPERFRRGPRFHDPSSQPMDTSAWLNPDIRAYVYAAERIQQTSSAAWLQQPEIASCNEVWKNDEEDIELPVNRINRPWKSKHNYLKAHFELLREDAVSPLREAIDDFRKNPQMMEEDRGKAAIYEKVHVKGFVFAHFGVAVRITFSISRAGKAILWEHTKRLMSGSIIALSPARDSFRSKCVLATVAARPLVGVQATPPEVDIYFARPGDLEIDPQQEWIMVEAKQGYYEASRHTLRALQKISQEKFPLATEICTMKKEVEAPAYVQDMRWINLSAAVESSEGKRAMSNINVLEHWSTAPESTLDKSQWAAMHQILTKRLAIIQGPPGTGKTHVSKIVLQIMVENKATGDPPIIVAAQTNHALDQLLGHISNFDPEYIRLGGRAKDLAVKKRALYEVRQKDRMPNLPGGLLGKTSQSIKRQGLEMIETLSPLSYDGMQPMSATTLLNLGVISEAQANSLEDGARQWVTAGDSRDEDAIKLWLNKALVPFEVVYKQDNFGFVEEEVDLEFEQLTEEQAEDGINDDEDIENLKGDYCAIYDKTTAVKAAGNFYAMAEQQLNTYHDLWKVRESLRGTMYSILKTRAKEAILNQFREQAKRYTELVRDLKIGKWERDAVYLQRANIIGMTTTGLSKYRPLIASLKPKIILIEEAAEVIEAPVAIACVESLEHLILVGDHQQLQPHCSVQDLEGDPYYLNVSMFERLVGNQMPFTTLIRQRRMDPEFRRLLAPIYGAQLEDHPDVIDRPLLPNGMGDVKSFFFNHEYPEHNDSQLSKINLQEAEFIAGFYKYLISNSVPPDHITILTFYNGQRKQILRHLKQDEAIKHQYTKVKTVDSYQGEENTIVILSLVRSNDHGNIGFLNVDNRVCVALSRAKRGFYIFGNGRLLASANMLWKNVLRIMGEDPNRVGPKFPIICQQHKRKTYIEFPRDWLNTDGGCDLPCTKTLECGHPCPLKCHVIDHAVVLCQKTCGRLLPCGHKCALVCSETPCSCKCGQFTRLAREARDQSPDGAGPFCNGEHITQANGQTTWFSNQTPRPNNDSQRRDMEARGNNNRRNGNTHSPRGGRRSPPKRTQPQKINTQVVGSGRAGVSNSNMRGSQPYRHQRGNTYWSNTTSPDDSRPCSSTGNSSPDIVGFGFGTPSHHSPEKQCQVKSQWNAFAGGGVKDDDLLRAKLMEEEREQVETQRAKENSSNGLLIDFGNEDGVVDDGGASKDSSPVKVKEMRGALNGRVRYTHEYRIALPRHGNIVLDATSAALEDAERRDFDLLD